MRPPSAQIDSEVKISIVCLRTPSELASGHCVLVGKGEKSFCTILGCF